MDNEIAKLFLEFSCSRLDMAAANLKAGLGKLTEEQVWVSDVDHDNAVGNLVLHLCVIIRQRVMLGVGATQDVRVRE